MKKLLFLFVLSTLAWAEDPFGGKIHSIESAARALVVQSTPATGQEPLTWGQQMAADDLKGLADAASALRLRLDEGEEDLGELDSQLKPMLVASNRVKISLPLARTDAEGQVILTGLTNQLKEVDQLLAQRREEEEKARLAWRSRPVIQPSIGWGWGWGSGWGWGFGRGWGGRGWGWCR
jgi:hypothetical protein